MLSSVWWPLGALHYLGYAYMAVILHHFQTVAFYSVYMSPGRL